MGGGGGGVLSRGEDNVQLTADLNLWVGGTIENSPIDSHSQYISMFYKVVNTELANTCQG